MLDVQEGELDRLYQRSLAQAQQAQAQHAAAGKYDQEEDVEEEEEEVSCHVVIVNRH